MSAGARLLDLLPAIFRVRDAEEALAIAAEYGLVAPDPVASEPEGPLTSLLAILEQQLDIIEAQVDNLHEDQFIETCAEWAIPYIGALVGARIVDVDDVGSARRQVANTIRNRRSKGTAAAIARVAGDVLDAPAEAIEYREHLVVSFNPNFPGEGRAMVAAINGPPGRAIGLPDYLGQRSVEVRDMREGGRFAAPNIGVRSWTTRALAHQEVVPTRATGGDPGRFRFSPLGADMALWRNPVVYEEGDDPSISRLGVEEIPGPIALRHAVDQPQAYYGLEASLSLSINGNFVPIDEICFCDLSDANPAGTSWNSRGLADELNKIRIDPQSGRFVLPPARIGLQANALRVRYHYGQAIEAGGGGYADPMALDAAAAVIVQNQTRAQATNALATALGQLAATRHVRIEYGGTMRPPANTTLPNGRDIMIAAGEGVWPTLELAADWRFTGGQRSRLTLHGLRLSGDRLHIDTNNLQELVIVDCTLVPGVSLRPNGQPASPGGIVLTVSQPGLRLVIQRSILGAIRVEGTVELVIEDSLLDSASGNDAVLAGLAGNSGGILTADRSTFLGDVALASVGEISDCLFGLHQGRTALTAPVRAELQQQGCVRYSALPPLSRMPRRYRCYPPEGAATALQPVFASQRYGDAAYGSLVPASPDGVLLGAEGGGEMGIMNRFGWHRRARSLARELPDWTPFAMTAGVEMKSE